MKIKQKENNYANQIDCKKVNKCCKYLSSQSMKNTTIQVDTDSHKIFKNRRRDKGKLPAMNNNTVLS